MEEESGKSLVVHGLDLREGLEAEHCQLQGENSREKEW